jgi:hypothetical protein
MSLRAYFAGQAMAAFVSTLSNTQILNGYVKTAEGRGVSTDGLIATLAVNQADALIAELEKGKEPA